MLKQDYKEGETTLKQALQLAVKVLSKTLDMTKLTSEKGMLVISIKYQIIHHADCKTKIVFSLICKICFLFDYFPI